MSVDHVFDVRATEPHEHRSAADTMRQALLQGPASDEDWTAAAPGWADQISITSWTGDRCVGHAGAFRFDTVVPGGARLATAGVTRVGVLPTATRNGLLSRMMRRLLDDARAEGRPLASLRASEAVIYRRFGFGVAADAVSVSIDTRRALPLANAAAGSVRVLDRHEVIDVVTEIYHRVASRPGAISRPPYLMERYLKDAVDPSAASFVVVHTADGPDGPVDDGFAHYSVRWQEADFEDPCGVGEVHDVWGASPAVELALWQFVLGIDLVRSYTVEERPADDVLHLAVRDRRAYQVKHRWDEQWVRLLDVEACLAARAYRPAAPVAIAVSDPWFADNDDTFEVGPGGVRRLGRSAAAEIRCEIDVVSAAYLGTVPWAALAAAGRVEGDADAVARADDLFRWHPGAFCGSFF